MKLLHRVLLGEQWQIMVGCELLSKMSFVQNDLSLSFQYAANDEDKVLSVGTSTQLCCNSNVVNTESYLCNI